MAKKTSAPSSGIKLVIVESPTKAKTIRKFLGKDYIVESCMGHIRDLPQSSKDIPEKVKKEKWAQLGVNVDKHFEPLYCIPKDKIKIVKNLKDKLVGCDELYLATDEDREGESISWHLSEVLKPTVPTKRMVFHEITKEAIEKALKDTREIDFNLVKAQEARRVLDRLVGYTISPLLWKKVAYGLSAGRVQSVAVKLIVERELERIKFKKSAYWGLSAMLEKASQEFEARLTTLSGKRIATGKDFDGLTGKLLADKDVELLQEAKATSLQKALLSKSFQVKEVEERPTIRRPSPPFITSTLQQESNRKLGLSSRETMQVAQKLYEQGFITYMRTDSTFLSNEAITAARKSIKHKYGADYLPDAPRSYAAKKVKGAQEAHEAIRPAGTDFVDPDETGLVGTQQRLYELIWKRTMASQMVDARQKQVSAKIEVEDAIFSASGMTIEFPGFLRAYVEGSDDPDAELAEREVRLPQLKQGEKVGCNKTEATSHETKPPARFTEASLVQTMEKEGIGRPSTYASVIGTIIDRGYVKKAGSALIPTFTAMIVSKLLSKSLATFVDLKFTSSMEQSLDDIADGELDWESYLASVYKGPKGLRALVDVQEKAIDPDEARTMSIEGMEKYTFHVGRYGAYLSTKRGEDQVSASLPDSEHPADITPEIAEKLIDQKINGSDALGKDPETGLNIYALNGRYGPYVQLGDVNAENDKPKRASLPPNTKLEDVTVEMAVKLLLLPKTLGTHPGTHKEIKAGLGRFGPFVVHEGDYRSIPKTESIFDMTLERALEMLSQPKKGRGKASAIRDLGLHPSGESIQIFNGPYGPYMKCSKVNASIPEGKTVETITLQEAIDLLNEKGGDKLKAAKAVKSAGDKKAKKPAKKVPKAAVKSTKANVKEGREDDEVESPEDAQMRAELEKLKAENAALKGKKSNSTSVKAKASVAPEIPAVKKTSKGGSTMKGRSALKGATARQKATILGVNRVVTRKKSSKK